MTASSTTHFLYDHDIFVMTEADGAVVFNQRKSEFLSIVPNETVQIFEMGSSSPGALLREAWESFEENDPRADELIRTLQFKDKLTDAVREVTTAASMEFEARMQKHLMKAATYGKAFCQNYPVAEFVETCKMMRVLNSVRQPDVGLFLTLTQANRMGPDGIVRRLLRRRSFLMAVRVCDYLGLATHNAVLEWACQKVKVDLDDETLAQKIVEKVKGVQGLPFAKVAQSALHAGKENLTILLLDHEPRASEQVPVLLAMSKQELALDKALESGDTDLVYRVLLRLQPSTTEDSDDEFGLGNIARGDEDASLQKLFYLLRSRPAAVELFVKYNKELHLDVVKDYLQRDNRSRETGDMHSQLAHKSAEQHDYDGAHDQLGKALANYRMTKETALEARLTEQESRLLVTHQDLATKTGSSRWYGMPLSRTLQEMVSTGSTPAAQKLCKQFKVPDKRWVYIRIKSYSAGGKWEDFLHVLTEKKKPIIGFMPFIRYADKHQAPDRVLREIIRRIPQPAIQVEQYMKHRMVKDAVEVSVHKKDAELLASIRAAPTLSNADKVFIDTAMAGLTDR
eukprot:TRINITY_DN5664_c0_g1_i1.p1 TRINITY_DN5664_c0_g1~~TRINITY_DN5664_c0_g1_i1.p1  ORF type:complete len:602 (-),score=141.48 TRINITY_DN5664_c0_g1_i1:47-1750(-)